MSDRPIRFAIADSPLGLLLVAVSARGACSVRVGECPEELEAGLRGELAAAAIRRDDAGLASWTGALVRLARGLPPGLELPLDVAAVGFRGRVWDALRAIPRGATRSYAEVARLVDRPRATRAVGQACAANPVALIVPCHRVVASDGGIGGYRWGTSRKRALLRAESAAVADPARGCRGGAAAR